MSKDSRLDVVKHAAGGQRAMSAMSLVEWPVSIMKDLVVHFLRCILKGDARPSFHRFSIRLVGAGNA